MPKLRHSRGLPLEIINHPDLLDMPDVAGVVGDHDARYYTETELDGGQLDNRYYTEIELGSIVAPSGASLIGVEDAGAFFAGADVEAVFQELMVAILPGAYLRLDGTNVPTANYNWTTNLTTTGTLQGVTITDGTISFTGGVGTGLVSLTDGVASWAGNSLAGFVNITATGIIQAEQLTSTDDCDIGDDLRVSGFTTSVGGYGTTNGDVSTLTGRFFSGNGTALLPSFSFSSDVDTGMWRSAADKLNFSVGGTEIVELAGGRMGINATPLATIHTTSAESGSGFQYGYRGDGTVTSSDNHVYGMFMGQTMAPGTSKWGLNLYAGGVINAIFGRSVKGTALYTAAITKTGTGTISHAYAIYAVAPVVGTNNYGIWMSGPATSYFGGSMLFPGVYDDDIGTERDLLIQADGQIGYDSSSEEYKENIVDLPDERSEKIYQLQPRRYDKINGSKNQIGLIAEEVNELYPEFISYKRKVTYKEVYDDMGGNGSWQEIDKITITDIPETVNYRRLIVPLIQEVQKLKARIDTLK